MKIIFLLAFIILLPATAQERNAPVPGKDAGGNVQLYIWQQGLSPLSAQNLQTAPGPGQLVISNAKLTNLEYNPSMATPEGLKIQPLRLLDTLNSGDSLMNTLFPMLAVNFEGSGLALDSFRTSAPVDFGYVDLDSTATKRVVLRNIGNSRLLLPVGNFYDTTSRSFIAGLDLGKTYIARNNPVYLNDVEWQTRQAEPPPVQGDPLQYADSASDNLIISLAPGDTVSFFVDARPTVLGRKYDTLVFEYADGLQAFSERIPMSILSAWTVKYSMKECRVRPATPSYDGTFEDTVMVYGNKGKRTRITSMRVAISFDPRDICVTGFEPNEDVFPEGWKFNVQNVVESEKYGRIFIDAWADTNIVLKQSAADPDQLSYFESGTAGSEVFGVIKARKLLGTGDSTLVEIDSLQSRHNYSMDYLFDTDTEIFDEALPYMTTVGGLVISDSLMFADKLYLGASFLDFRITNMFPNPAGQATEITVDLFVYTAAAVDAKIGFIDPYTGNKEGTEITHTFAPGANSIDLNIEHLGGESYFVYIKTENTTDVWLLNIMH